MEGKGNYLTLKEAAEQFGVHPNTLRNWDRRGVIRLEQLPGSHYRRVPKSEVERLANKAAQGLPPITSDRWVRSGEVLILLPPPEDPDSRRRSEEMAQEIQAELAAVEPQGTFEEAMQALRGRSWSA